SAGGFGADVGAMFQALPTLRVGVSVLNLGGPSITLRATPETFPVQMRAGVSLGVLGGRGQIAAEVDRTGDAALRLHGGTEYWIQPAMALRVGVDGDRATGGFAYQIGPRYQLDYGVADHPLGLPPPHVQWDGKDETGMPVADGLYTYRLVVKDKQGRILTSSTRRVEVSTGGPQGDVPVMTTTP